MPDYRSYCENVPAGASEIALSNEESVHLVAANRARPGDPVVAFDGIGNEWDTVLATANKRGATLRVIAHRIAKPPPCRIAIAQAIPKGKLLESIIKKATEIGATDVYPILSERVEIRIASDREETKNAKWHAAAVEGGKQSGNPFLPAIAPSLDLKRFLAESDRFDLRLLASLRPDAKPLREIIGSARQTDRPISSAIWLIGPEGDFTDDESDAAIRAGFLPASLGPHVMRCETAAIYALSCLCHELR